MPLNKYTDRFILKACTQTEEALLPVTEQVCEHYPDLYTEQPCQTSHLTQEHSDLQLLS